MAELKDSNGRWLTSALFEETNTGAGGFKPITNFKKAHDRYIELNDPTEYSFAMELLGSWEHWKTLVESATFRTHIALWREELEIKLRSEAIKEIIAVSTTEKARGTTAAKWLAEGGWKESVNARGRPSAAEIKRTRRIHAGITDEVGDDFDRLKLN